MAARTRDHGHRVGDNSLISTSHHRHIPVNYILYRVNMIRYLVFVFTPSEFARRDMSD